MVKAKKFVLVKMFEGEPTHNNFELQEEELPALKDGDVLVEAVWLSVDPYHRVYGTRQEAGGTMIGAQVAR